MGQAFDRDGAVLGEARGDTKREVFEKLDKAHADAAEIRIRSLQPHTAHLNFGQALEALKEGKAVQRAGWNGKGMWLRLQTPDSGSKMTLPYIYMSTVEGALVPWLASQSDILASDWGII